MTAHAAVRPIAALMTFLSLTLAAWVHPAWLGLMAFVGLNLTQFAFSGFCPALSLLRLFGLPPMPAGPERDAGNRAQLIVGPALALVAALGWFVPALGVPFAAVTGGIIALSFGQSAFTGTCPALFVARRWAHR